MKNRREEKIVINSHQIIVVIFGTYTYTYVHDIHDILIRGKKRERTYVCLPSLSSLHNFTILILLFIDVVLIRSSSVLSTNISYWSGNLS